MQTIELTWPIMSSLPSHGSEYASNMPHLTKIKGGGGTRGALSRVCQGFWNPSVSATFEFNFRLTYIRLEFMNLSLAFSFSSNELRQIAGSFSPRRGLLEQIKNVHFWVQLVTFFPPNELTKCCKFSPGGEGGVKGGLCETFSQSFMGQFFFFSHYRMLFSIYIEYFFPFTSNAFFFYIECWFSPHRMLLTKLTFSSNLKWWPAIPLIFFMNGLEQHTPTP